MRIQLLCGVLLLTGCSMSGRDSEQSASMGVGEPSRIIEPLTRSFSLCYLAKQSSSLLRAKVDRWSLPVVLPDPREPDIGYRMTQVSVSRVSTLAGSMMPASVELFVGDQIDPATGSSDRFGSFRRPDEDVYFFVVENVGKYFVHPSGGYFWQQGALMANGMEYKKGIPVGQFFTEVAQAGSTICPEEEAAEWVRVHSVQSPALPESSDGGK